MHTRQKSVWLNHHHKRAASAVIILEEGDTALVIRTHYKPLWTLPGGFVDPDETPILAAVREVSEEVGLEIDIKSVHFGWVAARHSSIADTYQFIFRAALPADAGGNVVLQASEIDDWKFVTKSDIMSNPDEYSEALRRWADDKLEHYIEEDIS